MIKKYVKKLLRWLANRLKEKSSWAAIFVFLGTNFGVQVAPELQKDITQAGIALLGVVAFYTKSKNNE